MPGNPFFPLNYPSVHTPDTKSHWNSRNLKHLGQILWFLCHFYGWPEYVILCEHLSSCSHSHVSVFIVFLCNYPYPNHFEKCVTVELLISYSYMYCASMVLATQDTHVIDLWQAHHDNAVFTFQILSHYWKLKATKPFVCFFGLPCYTITQFWYRISLKK